MSDIEIGRDYIAKQIKSAMSVNENFKHISGDQLEAEVNRDVDMIIAAVKDMHASEVVTEGCFVLVDDKYERVAHVHEVTPDGVARLQFAEAGSYYLFSGGSCSFGGSLKLSSTVRLKRSKQSKTGDAWMFHLGRGGGECGLSFKVLMPVWEVVSFEVPVPVWEVIQEDPKVATEAPAEEKYREIYVPNEGIANKIHHGLTIAFGVGIPLGTKTDHRGSEMYRFILPNSKMNAAIAICAAIDCEFYVSDL